MIPVFPNNPLRRRHLLAITALLAWTAYAASAAPATAFAQDPPAHSPSKTTRAGEPEAGQRLHAAHTAFSKRAMYVLGGWAVLNLAAGTAGRAGSSGRTRYFHEMNAAWNTVNLAIAGFSLMGLQHADFESAARTFRDAQQLDTFLLLNSGLDAAYIAAGGFLIERGLRLDRDRLVGYGRSMLIQGGFLLVFDVALYALHRPITAELFEHLTLAPALLEPFGGVGLTVADAPGLPAADASAPLSAPAPPAPGLSLTLRF